MPQTERSRSFGRFQHRSTGDAAREAGAVSSSWAPSSRRAAEGEASSHSAAAEVTVVAVAPRDVPISGEYIAQTQSSRQVSIQARVNGFLERRVYTEGEFVREGDVLFLMDGRPYARSRWMRRRRRSPARWLRSRPPG